jgi:hypothetical protein
MINKWFDLVGKQVGRLINGWVVRSDVPTPKLAPSWAKSLKLRNF